MTPIYVWKCPHCGAGVEVPMPVWHCSEPPVRYCDGDGGCGNVMELVLGPPALMFKGSGWTPKSGKAKRDA